MVTLFVAGDVVLARGIDQILGEPCDPTLYEPYMNDAREYIDLAEETSGAIPRHVPPAYVWGDALAWLDAAHPDARVVNLETSITRRGAHDRHKRIHYRVSPQNAATLVAARIDVCTLANNHVLDWGPLGLTDTLDTLDRLQVRRCGAGHDLDEAMRPAVVELGARGRIAVFAVGCDDAGVPPSWSAAAQRPGVFELAELDDAAVARVRAAIEPWRQPGTRVVLSIHWGSNWDFAIERTHRRFAHRMIDEAGVDLVHGHSSHHVKGIEVHHGRPILYGCGDLITDYEGIRGNEAYRGELGLLYLVTLDDAGVLTGLQMVPTRMHRFQLTAPPAEDVRWLARTLDRCGEPLGTSVAIADHQLTLRW